jgi:hypothetical protein
MSVNNQLGVEADIVESMNFLGGRGEHHRHWNIPVPDRDADQVPPEYRLENYQLSQTPKWETKKIYQSGWPIPGSH